MLYYTEWKREDGHPDFAYTQIKFLELDIEEKNRNELIKKALDRMNHYYKDVTIPEKPLDMEADEKKTVEIQQKGEEETHESALDQPKDKMNFKEKPKTRKSISVKKIVTVSLVLTILGVFLWHIPTIILMFQPSYTKLTLMKNSEPSPNMTTLTFGDVDYFLEYSWQGYLVVSNSLLEGKFYQPMNGSVYKDIGIEIQVSEAYSNYIVLFVKPVPNYLAQTSFTKLTIAQGQYQTVNFSGNEYTIGYLQNLPYYANKLIVMTPLLQSREYYVISSQIIDCDLGLEIRVYKATSEYIIIFVKPTY